MIITASRTHEIHCGHRVVGHEGKCQHLHGHSYGFAFSCEPERELLDRIGRVVDFSVIKSRLCVWLEDNWDHRLLLWERDPLLPFLRDLDPSVVAVPFNPTAENIAQHLGTLIGPALMVDSGARLTAVTVHETSKCSATWTE